MIEESQEAPVIPTSGKESGNRAPGTVSKIITGTSDPGRRQS